MNIRTLPITQRREIAEGTVEVEFGLGDRPFEYAAGQYVRVTLPNLHTEDSRGNYRDFSLASSPTRKDALVIAFRVSESDFKRSLLELPIGSPVKVTGPFGGFTLPEDTQQPMVFLAGGIGVTPYFSKLTSVSKTRGPRDITLLYANASPDRIAYKKELEDLQRDDHSFRVFFIDGDLGVDHIRRFVPDFFSVRWEIAGPPSMVENMTDVLTSLGVAPSAIFSEEFLGYEPGSTLSSKAALVAAETPHVSRVELFRARSEAIQNALNKTALVSETDVTGTILYVNDTFVEISKYEREELIGQNHRILKSGFHPSSFYQELWKTISSGHVWRGEIKNRAKDGSTYWVDTSIAPITDEAGKPLKYFSVRFPITERKEAEEMLGRRTEDLEETQKAITNVLEDVEEQKNVLAEEKAKDLAILSSIGEGVVATDTKGRVIFSNEAASDILGYAPEQFRGMVWAKDLPNEFDEKGNPVPLGKRAFFIALSEKRKTTKELILERMDGVRIPVVITTSPVFLNDSMNGMVIVFRDITHEKEIDKVKTEFVSLASHQLLTPLSTIKWYVEMFMEGDAGKTSPEQRRFLQEIYNGNERMVALVNALLNVSRLELGTFIVEPAPADIVEISKLALKEIEPDIFRRKLGVHEHYVSDIPQIPLDPRLMKVVFQNLLSNAVKYTPEAGRIDVSISILSARSSNPFRPSEGGMVLISVKDTGYGIPREQQPKIFTKLFRADNIRLKNTEGTGLGLYIVKSILEKTGGKIWFESEENKGTTFYVTLPLTGMKKKTGTRTIEGF